MIKVIISVFIFALCSVALIACQGSPGGQGANRSGSLSTPSDLASEIVKAHALQKLSGLEKLSILDGLDEMTRTGIQQSFAEILARKLDAVTVEPLDPSMTLEYEINGRRYRPNLVPEGRIRISFVSTQDEADPLTSTTFLFGKVNGEYRLGFSKPADE